MSWSSPFCHDLSSQICHALHIQHSLLNVKTSAWTPNKIPFHSPATEDHVLRRHIWTSLIPSTLPLGDDVDLASLAMRYELSGGFIKTLGTWNEKAMLKTKMKWLKGDRIVALCGVPWSNLELGLTLQSRDIRDYFTVPTDETATFPFPASFASKLSSNIPSLACHFALRNAILTALSIACSRAQETSGDGKPDVRITQVHPAPRRKSFTFFYPEKANHNPVDPCSVHLRYLPLFTYILVDFLW